MKNLKINKSLSRLIVSLSSALALSLTASQNLAIASGIDNAYQNNDSAALPAQSSAFSNAELEQMLAPIALYPDSLLSHILIAATYPIEVVDAERWLANNSHLTDSELADQAENKDWDASVKALLPFANILQKLSNDLHWMRNLGDAFLQDQEQVLASVQSLRQQADLAGNLEKMDNVNIVRETKTIIIKPSTPEVIYVPYYNTREIYGHWRWAHLPPVYWHYPSHYSHHHGPYYWHNPVHLTVGLFFGSVHWHNRHVVVHHHKSRYYKHHSNKKVSTSRQGKKWQHNSHHRKGVAYRTAHIQKKYRSSTPSRHQQKIIRSKNASLHTSKQHKYKSTNTLHKKVSHKLKVNQAVKINKQAAKKHNLNKSEPYKNAKWRTHSSSKPNAHKVKTVKVNKSYTGNKPTYTDKAVKTYKPAKVYKTNNSTSKAKHTSSHKKQYNRSSKSSAAKTASVSRKSHKSGGQRHSQKKRH